MPQVFISYVEEDFKIALQISKGLESAGIQTWYYHRDSLVGDFLDNIVAALEDSQAMIVIISPMSLEKSNQVNIEVVRAHEKRKIFQPVLVNVTWDDLEEKQKKWRLVMASSIGITWNEEHKDEILDEIVKAILKEKSPSPTPEPPPPPPISELFDSSGALLLERFEPILGQALTSLPQEVQVVGHNLIGTPHIFNVLLGIKGGPTQQAVASQSIDPLELRLALRNSIQRGDQQHSGGVPPLVREAFSPNGLASLESAWRIAHHQGDDEFPYRDEQGRVLILEADLLLAIVNNKQSITVRMLNRMDNLAEKIQDFIRIGNYYLSR